MTGAGDRLDELAAQIADGIPVDWTPFDAEHTLPEVRSLAEAFRLLERISMAHSSGGAGPRPRPLPAPRERQRWGHLEVVERVGQGGFAEVFRARDPLLDREVALKLLHPRRDDGEAAQEEFLREGRLLARLKHPNVVTVHGADRIAGRIGIWMELIQGETLAHLVRRDGSFSADEALLIGVRLCDALSALHAAGLVHRDVKAQNVMRESGGRIVLMDFGTARDLGEAHGETRLRGTPIYMAPEQLAGEPASPQSDIYSMGVLLHHLVSGAFPARPGQAEPTPGAPAPLPRRLRDRRPGLPADYYAIVERALDPDPRERYASAGEMGRALTAALIRPSAPPPSGDARGVPPEAAVNRAATPGSAARLVPPRPQRSTLLLAALALVSVGVAMQTVSSDARGPSISRLAVAPFVNVTGDAGDDYLAHAVPIELISRLGQIPDVTVVPWSVTRRYRETPGTIEDIAAATGADAVVEGSVHRVPPRSDGEPWRINVKVQVFQSSSRALIWEEESRGRMGEFLVMQDRLARELAARLHSRIARREMLLSTTAAAAPEAMESYLRAQDALESRTPERLQAAESFFRDAIAKDPGFAEAHVGLAQAATLRHVFGGSPTASEALEIALAATQRALDIDDRNGCAWGTRAFAHYVLAWDWQSAGNEFRIALGLSPHGPEVNHWYADYLSALGRHDDALRHMRIAAERSPRSPIRSRDVAWMYYFARRYDEAIAQLHGTLALEPDYPAALTLLARAYVMKQRPDEAERYFARVDGYSLMRAQGLAAAGRTAEAWALLAEVEAAPEGDEVRNPYLLALVYAALGETDSAFEALELAFAQRDSALIAVFTDPMVDSLRDDPRFPQLLARLGFHERSPATS